MRWYQNRWQFYLELIKNRNGKVHCCVFYSGPSLDTDAQVYTSEASFGRITSYQSSMIVGSGTLGYWRFIQLSSMEVCIKLENHGIGTVVRTISALPKSPLAHLVLLYRNGRIGKVLARSRLARDQHAITSWVPFAKYLIEAFHPSCNRRLGKVLARLRLARD